MKAYLINMHLLVPRSRSSAKVKVKCKGYISQKMAVSGAFVFHKHILFNFRLNPDGPQRRFMLHPWLRSEEDELNFLKKISELILLEVLPKNYLKAKPIRNLFREVLANTGTYLTLSQTSPGLYVSVV